MPSPVQAAGATCSWRSPRAPIDPDSESESSAWAGASPSLAWGATHDLTGPALNGMLGGPIWRCAHDRRGHLARSRRGSVHSRPEPRQASRRQSHGDCATRTPPATEAGGGHGASSGGPGRGMPAWQWRAAGLRECELAQSPAPHPVAAALYFAGRRRAAGSLAPTPRRPSPDHACACIVAAHKANRTAPAACGIVARHGVPASRWHGIPAGTVSHVVAMDAHVLNKSVRWIRLQQSSTEWYSLDSTTGELQVVRDFVTLATIRTVSNYSYR